MYARSQRFNLAQGLIELAWDLADRIDALLRRQPGFVSSTLLCDESSGEYILLTYWDTLDAIGAFERSRDEWRMRDILSPHLTAVPQIEIFQVHALPARPDAARRETEAVGH